MLLEKISNPAKIKIIKLLINFKTPLCFRDIVTLTGLGIRSVQSTILDFENDKIIKSRREKNRKLYTIINTQEINEFRKFINYQDLEKIKLQSEEYSSKSRKLLHDINKIISFSQYLNLVKCKKN